MRQQLLWSLVLVAAATAGCADMTVEVEVCTSDLMLHQDAKLSEAVGLAAHIRQISNNFSKLLQYDNPRDDDDTRAYSVKSVSDEYERQRIDELVNAYREDPKDDRRAELIASLGRFGTFARNQGGELIMVETGKTVYPFPNYFRLLHRNVQNRFECGEMFELEGNRIVQLSDALLRHDGQAQISQVMQSTELGPATEFLFYKAPLYHSLRDGLNWKNINTVRVRADGNSNHVIIKDAIGNWHIKSITNDVSEVVDAAFDSATTMVGIIAKAYGIPIPTGSAGASPTTAPSSDTSVGSFGKTELAAARAESARSQLRAARAALRRSISDAITAGKTTSQITDALDEFIAELDAIQVDAGTQTSSQGQSSSAQNSDSAQSEPPASSGSSSSTVPN